MCLRYDLSMLIIAPVHIYIYIGKYSTGSFIAAGEDVKFEKWKKRGEWERIREKTENNRGNMDWWGGGVPCT